VAYRQPRVAPKADPCPVVYTVAIPADITPLDLCVCVERERGGGAERVSE